MGEGAGARPDLLDRFADRVAGHAEDVVAPMVRALHEAMSRLRPTVFAPEAARLEPILDAVHAHHRHETALAEHVARVALAFREADGASAGSAGFGPGSLSTLDAVLTTAVPRPRRRAPNLAPAAHARYQRGVQLAEALAVAGVYDWSRLRRTDLLAGALHHHRRDPLVVAGLFDTLGPAGALAAMDHVLALVASGAPGSRSMAASLASMLGRYTRRLEAGRLPGGARVALADWTATLAPPDPDDRLARVVAAYATGPGRFASGVAVAMVDTALRREPFGALVANPVVPQVAEAAPGGDGDLLGRALTMAVRSGAEAELLADKARVLDLLSPDRVYTPTGAAALMAVLDQPRRALLADPGDRAAIAAVGSFVEVTGRRAGVVHQLAGRPFAHLLLSFPAALAAYGSGLDATGGTSTLAAGLGRVELDAGDAHLFVAAARMADDTRFEPEPSLAETTGHDLYGVVGLPGAGPPPYGAPSWSAAIDGALGAVALAALTSAVVRRAGGDHRGAARASALAGHAELTLLRSGVRRRLIDGERHDARAERSAAHRRFVVDIGLEVSGLLPPVTLAATAVELVVAVPEVSAALDRLLGASGGEADRACDPVPAMAASLRAANEAVAIESAVAAGLVDPARLPAALHTDPRDLGSSLVGLAGLATPARGGARAVAIHRLRSTGVLEDFDAVETQLDGYDGVADCQG